MKILFSPSEQKSSISTDENFSSDFIFPEILEKRVEILQNFNKFIQNSSLQRLEKLFGIKNENLIKYYSQDLFKKPTTKAILRYNGVAYEALSYAKLSQKEQNFIDENVLIFSNLYGPILAKDKICDYRLKQGENIDNFSNEKFYKEISSNLIDEFLKDEFIVDLRAGFYEKFYQLKKPFVTFKFLKTNKVVSHFAKFYRGKILSDLAKFTPKDEKELICLNYEGLKINSILKQGIKTEIICDILG